MKDLNLTPAAVAALAGGDFGNFLAAATPGGIERQEKQGQEALTANFDKLPREGLYEYRPVLERMGFVFGEPVEHDDLFINVTPPAGWQLKPTDHSMWSDLLDDKGRRRGGVFYKAAFYDRRADVRLDRRYYVDREYQEGGEGSRHLVKDRHDGKIVHEFDWILCSREAPQEERRKSYDMQDAQHAQARAWLLANFPDYESVEAYW